MAKPTIIVTEFETRPGSTPQKTDLEPAPRFLEHGESNEGLPIWERSEPPSPLEVLNRRNPEETRVELDPGTKLYYPAGTRPPASGEGKRRRRRPKQREWRSIPEPGDRSVDSEPGRLWSRSQDPPTTRTRGTT